jgi:hypothetical protein
MHDSLTFPRDGITPPDARAAHFLDAVRGSEWVLMVFLIYAAAAAVLLPAGSDVIERVALWNFGVILVYGLLIYVDRDNRSLAISVARDWMPLAVLLLAYQEMGWFALPQHSHMLESRWVTWDRLVLRGGAKPAIEAFGPVLPSILEIAYSLSIFIAAAIA